MSTDRVLVVVLLGCVAVWATAEALPAAAWLAVVSVLFGGVITGLFSWYYYQRASEKLRREAEQLRRHTTLIMNALEAGPPIEFERAEQPGVHGQGRDREMEEGKDGPRPYESDWRPT
jgi:Flp pilus assembly protein TadB